MPPSPIVRYVATAVSILVTLHYIFSFSHEEYGRNMSLSRWVPGQSPRKQPIPSKYYPYTPVTEGTNTTTTTTIIRKANAAFVLLARNSDLPGVLESLKQLEDRFNKKFRYPFVFLNEEDFSEDFKKWTSEVTSTPCAYGKIPRDHWFQPDWIDEAKAAEYRLKLVEANIVYGDSVPYRNMCRFNSGFFFRHELLKNYDYYWRIEPGVKFFCDIDYDPFLLMQDEKKVYGFVVSLFEYTETILTLWDATKEFIQANPELLPAGNAMGFLSDDGGETYNHCHFWSNFEIADLNFWRGEAYMKFFDFLDRKGGFYYERWGDAPVHSIAAALFAHRDQIHFFEDIGYRHEPIQHCPQGKSHAKGKCWCSTSLNFDYEWLSCLSKFDALF
ncbi:glycosyltransferase family 15 protein [Hydnum rufescens UP504]|uniref:Glycosyltransferase family 15 protein n=1 Tax=Hydnum rufescens UP504 TaxID=1448309 RepID=A0A9P6DSP1_9AGAM|nr:glycosyltransferase family 15 protein [Hydnum rufescens UP504]